MFTRRSCRDSEIRDYLHVFELRVCKQILANNARPISDRKDFQRKVAKVQRRKGLAIFLKIKLFSIFFPLRLRGFATLR